QKGIWEFPTEFRNSETYLGIPKRLSEFGKGFGNSQTGFGVRKRIWEFPTEFRSSETDLAVPDGISEFRKGFGNSQPNFGVQKQIWELPWVPSCLISSLGMDPSTPRTNGSRSPASAR